jgi:hypothetical protein
VSRLSLKSTQESNVKKKKLKKKKSISNHQFYRKGPLKKEKNQKKAFITKVFLVQPLLMTTNSKTSTPSNPQSNKNYNLSKSLFKKTFSFKTPTIIISEAKLPTF